MDITELFLFILSNRVKMSSIRVIRNICLSICLPSTMIGMATKVNLSPLMSNLLYNAWGQRTHVKIGSTNLATYHYSQDSNRYLDRLEFGNAMWYNISMMI